MVTSGLFWFEIKFLLDPLARKRYIYIYIFFFLSFFLSFFCPTMITSDLLDSNKFLLLLPFGWETIGFLLKLEKGRSQVGNDESPRCLHPLPCPMSHVTNASLLDRHPFTPHILQNHFNRPLHQFSIFNIVADLLSYGHPIWCLYLSVNGMLYLLSANHKFRKLKPQTPNYM